VAILTNSNHGVLCSHRGSEVATATGLARDQQLIIEVRTPSVLLLLTKLRDRRSDAATFRRATGRIIMCATALGSLAGLWSHAHVACVNRILIEEVLGVLDARAVQVVTSSGQAVQGIERRHEICGVKLGDEGYPFSVLFHQVEVDAAEGRRQRIRCCLAAQASIQTDGLIRCILHRTDRVHSS
jgi:hypothetical protein